MLPTGVVALNSPAKVVVGDLHGTTSTQVHCVVDAFRAAGIATEESQDIHRDLWLKLLWNVGIFQWCAIRDCTIGELFSDEENVHRVRDTMTEVVNVARINGVNISETDIEPQIESARLKYAPVTPSLLQDLRAGRPLEVASFAGFISRQGKEHQIQTSLNDWLFVELNRRTLVHARSQLPVTSTDWGKGIVSGTHIGTREKQQDAVLVHLSENETIAVLSDGHGLAGDDVSQMAVNGFVKALTESSPSSPPEKRLADAIQSTDQEILIWLKKQFPKYLRYASFDSGATLLGVMSQGTDLWIAHVGDSRAYHLSRQHRLALRLTTDHEVSSRSLGHHWDKSAGKTNATPDLFHVEDFVPGDVIVISSDGLYMTPEEIMEIVLDQTVTDPEKKLIQTSFKNSAFDLTRLSVASMNPKHLKNQGIDNTTAIIIKPLCKTKV